MQTDQPYTPLVRTTYTLHRRQQPEQQQQQQQQQQQHSVVHAPKDTTVEREETQHVEHIEVEQEPHARVSKRQRLKKAAAGAWRGIRSLVRLTTKHTLYMLISTYGFCSDMCCVVH
jgi:hemolysin activation/secretion protein